MTSTITGTIDTTATTSTDDRRVVANADLADFIGWQRAHNGTSEVWSTITDAHRDGDQIVIRCAEYNPTLTLRLDATTGTDPRDAHNVSIVRRPLTCRRCRRPLSRRNTRVDLRPDARPDIAFTHIVDGVPVAPCDDYGAAPLPDAPAAGSSVTARGGLDYVRVPQYDGYACLDEDDMVVMFDGLVVAGTFRTRPSRDGREWASWGPAGHSSRHTTREAAEDVQIAAHRAGLADEQATFFDRGQGRLSTIARYGRRVIVVERGDVLSDHTFDTVERAAAEYANWRCDRRTDVPRRGDVIEILGVMDTDTVIAVSTVSVSTVTRAGATYPKYKISGKRLGGDGPAGVSVSRTVTRAAFYFVSRSVPVSVSAPVSTAVSVSTGAPTAGVPVPPGASTGDGHIAAAPAGVSTAAPAPGVSMPAPAARPVPRAPRTRPTTWSDVVPDGRPAPRIPGADPAEPLPSAGHLAVEYTIEIPTPGGAAAGRWDTVEHGERLLSQVTFDALQAAADELLTRHWRGDSRVRVTVAGTNAAGRPVWATLHGFATGRRTWPRRTPAPAGTGSPTTTG